MQTPWWIRHSLCAKGVYRLVGERRPDQEQLVYRTACNILAGSGVIEMAKLAIRRKDLF